LNGTKSAKMQVAAKRHPIKFAKQLLDVSKLLIGGVPGSGRRLFFTDYGLISRYSG